MKNFFKRYEKKYIIDAIQYELLMHFVQGRMAEDKRTGYTISNLYYDTDDYELIRASIEKPVYKEKLRIRTYGTPQLNGPAYIELKKKVEGVVYKRRFKTDMINGIAFLGGDSLSEITAEDRHTISEIQHFLNTYRVKPKALISYNRQCFHGTNDSDFRMTFDSNIQFGSVSDIVGFIENDISKPVLEPEKMIMEIKTPTSIPVWLTKIMSELEIFPSSFSKYGEAYKTYICNEIFQNNFFNDSKFIGSKANNKKEVGLSA